MDSNLFLVIDAQEALDPNRTHYIHINLTYYAGGKKAEKQMACCVDPTDIGESHAEIFWSMSVESPLSSIDSGGWRNRGR